MPRRRIVITPGEIYHVFNRSVGSIPVFFSTREYRRAREVFEFYTYDKPPLRFSRFNVLPGEQKAAFFQRLRENVKIVELFVYCLMPNHVHFLLRELVEDGISTFMSNFQNSYAKYFNTKFDRSGTLFQSMFKAVRIETDEQLLHVSRYIHLNPVTSYLLQSAEDLDNYRWSSWSSYNQQNAADIINTSLVMSHFKSLPDFRKFNFDQVACQRSLDEIKHLTLEKP